MTVTCLHGSSKRRKRIPQKPLLCRCASTPSLGRRTKVGPRRTSIWGSFGPDFGFLGPALCKAVFQNMGSFTSNGPKCSVPGGFSGTIGTLGTSTWSGPTCMKTFSAERSCGTKNTATEPHLSLLQPLLPFTRRQFRIFQPTCPDQPNHFPCVHSSFLPFALVPLPGPKLKSLHRGCSPNPRLLLSRPPSKRRTPRAS